MEKIYQVVEYHRIFHKGNGHDRVPMTTYHEVATRTLPEVEAKRAFRDLADRRVSVEVLDGNLRVAVKNMTDFLRDMTPEGW